MLKKFLISLTLLLVFLFTLNLENTFALIYTVDAFVLCGNGKVSPVVQKVKPNGRATITIKPDTGYHLDQIIDNGMPMKLVNPYAIPYVNENHFVDFAFVINTYKITASVSGGYGKVTPTAIDVTHGDKATITIIPDEGYKITGIMDNGNSIGISNPLVLNNISANHNIVVAFTSFTVTATVLGYNGTVSPLTQTVQSGGKATITIKPAEGYMIDKIRDNGKEQKIVNPYVIYGISGNRKIEVSFKTAVLNITASVAGGHGSVFPESTTVLYGESAKIVVRPDEGYHITGITDNGVPIPIQDPIYLYDIKVDHKIVVSFIEFTIYARMIDDHGVLKPERSTMFYGGKTTINIEPDTGFKVWYIIDNGSWKSPTTPTTYVINSVTEDHLVEVAYMGITFTVKTLIPGGHGTADVLTQTVRYGSQVTLNLRADPGYDITGIMDNGKPKIAASPYVIKSVTEDHTVIVTFLTYAVFATVADEHGYVSPAMQYVYAGQKASIVIIPEAGYHIDKILDNDKPMTIKTPYVIQNILENHAIEVSFAINTYTITASVLGGHGKVEPPTQTINYGEKATIKITPDKGYIIESITDNGIKVPIDNPYDIFYITSNHKVEIKFVAKK